MQIHLFTQYYKPNDAQRRREVDECLRRNIANPHIDRVHVLLEREEDRESIPSGPKVIVAHEPARMTYGRWLVLTNQLEPGSLSILINSDIYLDESVQVLRDHGSLLAQEQVFMALTRYNREPGQLVLNSNPHWCQDSWAIVRGERPFARPLLQETNFELGQPGCDNKISYVMHSYGYRVSNPCLVWRTVHLHADEGRPYDERADKLLGLHAFVHPVMEVGEASKLDFELLSRNPADLLDLNVNHWINGRRAYRLSGSSGNAANQPQARRTVLAELLEQARVIDHGSHHDISLPRPVGHGAGELQSSGAAVEAGIGVASGRMARLPFEYVRRDSLDLTKLNRTNRFNHRFALYRDATHCYWIDSAWPGVAKLSLAQLPDGFERWSEVDKFALGFAIPVLDQYPIAVAPKPRHRNDLLFWQYPCRTEQDAWEQACSAPSFHVSDVERDIYVGLPWATFIDRNKAHQVTLVLIASRLKLVRDFLAQHGVRLRVHTVCQHIFWSRHLDWFRDLGVTDLWISHKEKGRDEEGGIRLHAWALYAVNYRDPSRQTGLEVKPMAERGTFASFAGAHMKHYLSDVRLRLQALAGLPGYEVRLTNEWHFNKLVYNYQVKGDVAAADATDSDAVLGYNRLLSDSVFSLCPVGAGPNTLRLWESLAAGSIPVVLSDLHELPDLERVAPGSGLCWEDALILHPEDELDTLDARLRAIPLERLEQMQRNGRLLYLLCERFTPVSALTIEPSTMPLALIDRFKPQQLQVAGRTRSVVDGYARLESAELPLSDAEQSATLYFDQTEQIVGLMVEVRGGSPDGIEFDIGLSPRFNRLVPLLESCRPDSRFNVFWFDSGASNWALGLKLTARCSHPGSALRLVLHPVVSANRFACEMRRLDGQGVLAAASATNGQRCDDLFDTEHVESGAIASRLDDYARTHPVQSGRRLFPDLASAMHNLAGEPLRDGITMYVHLMNRNGNVARNLSNWLGQKIDELILLDWSSEPPVSSIPGLFDDPRVRVVRVEGQTQFIRSWAQNLASRMASNRRIFKCDSDVTFSGDFFGSHPLQQGEFWVGDWHQARDFNERHLHGGTYYHIDDFLRVGGYDERITSYGHDDTNLKDRMVLAGLVKRVFSYNQLYHEPHDNQLRTTNQTMLHPMVNTRYHRLLVNQAQVWSSLISSSVQFKVDVVGEQQAVAYVKEANLGNLCDEKILDQAIEMVAAWYVERKVVSVMSREDRLRAIWIGSVE